MTGDPVLELDRVVKRFGDVTAVHALSLAIERGEFFSLLGPSGCGKTTTLRMLAGFETPDEGRILLDGVDVTDVPPDRRNVNMVFQSYALFPHLDVVGNVAYGLRRQRLPRDVIDREVTRILDQVELPRSRFGARRPKQLSGGQQQRVALARALVKQPQALLLDEPLGALDLKLRRGMQLELKAMQHELDMTFVYVTHDQEEALTMSDRIAVMDHGRVVQVGTPRDIYESPRTRFVAGFIGASNLIELPVARAHDGHLSLALPDGIPGRVVARAEPGAGDPTAASLSLRPEHLTVVDRDEPASEGCWLEGTVTTSAYLGTTVHHQVEVHGVGRFLVAESARSPARARGIEIRITWRPEDAVVLEDTPAGAVGSQVIGEGGDEDDGSLAVD
jgi:spermidine/putrescine transport system ATP-binding protein